MLKSQLIVNIAFRRHNIRKYAAFNPNSNNDSPNDNFENSLHKFREKILFNSHLDQDRLKMSHMTLYTLKMNEAKREHKRNMVVRSLPPLPLSLKYVMGENKLLKEKCNTCDPSSEQIVQLPFNENEKVTKNVENDTSSEDKSEFDRSKIDKWMTNYEYFDDAKLDETSLDDIDEESDLNWTSNYGTPDPNSRISNIPCNGCGALLHCTDTAIPGYIPSEIFKGRTQNELKNIECQRCHFLKEYNIALNINVEPDDYLSLLSNISRKRALVIVMVDLLDFPCSIWPKLIDIVGTKRPVIIVGNKVDLLPGDERGYLERIKQSLEAEIKKTSLEQANIKSISLISAKTGYGVEELISTMFKVWLGKGDVYLIGCTNVGKSSLFNALLQSDYCKVHAHDLIKRATVSRWPGTTLNLLKFPINRPSGWKIFNRNKRLRVHEKLLKAEIEILEHDNQFSSKRPSLIGHIGRSFYDPKKLLEEHHDGQSREQKFGINEKDPVYVHSKWFYDTPGVVHPDQILSLLTAEELLQVIPKTMIQPHSYFLQQGTTIFIAGLARIDFIESSYPCRLTVFCSDDMPVTVCATENADEIYQQFLGTNLLAVPKGSAERFEKWPGLQANKEVIKLTGVGNKECCADIVLSSTGWISVTAPNSIECKFIAWTPESRGIHVRQPPLLKYGIMLKGNRIRDTPAYRLRSVSHNPKKVYSQNKT